VTVTVTVGVTGDYRYHVMLDYRGWRLSDSDSGCHWGLQISHNARSERVVAK
jgi:hypothetical protein